MELCWLRGGKGTVVLNAAQFSRFLYEVKDKRLTRD